MCVCLSSGWQSKAPDSKHHRILLGKCERSKKLGFYLSDHRLWVRVYISLAAGLWLDKEWLWTIPISSLLREQRGDELYYPAVWSPVGSGLLTSVIGWIFSHCIIWPKISVSYCRQFAFRSQGSARWAHIQTDASFRITSVYTFICTSTVKSAFTYKHKRLKGDVWLTRQWFE